VDGYATLNLAAQTELRSGVTFFVDARNLTKKRAIGDISAVVGYVGQATFYPIERRAVYAGLRARL
jgi:iron complex outermembrane receptor protein